MDFAQVLGQGGTADDGPDVARKAFNFRNLIKSMQYSFTAIEKVGPL